MSRIGRVPVPVPTGVDVTIDGPVVTVTGPKGTLTHNVPSPIAVVRDDQGALGAVDRHHASVDRDVHAGGDRDGDSADTRHG